MSVCIKYDEISMQDKFIMMEELWENMTQNAQDNGFTPQWHLKTLASREDGIENSKTSFDDLENAKQRLQKLA